MTYQPNLFEPGINAGNAEELIRIVLDTMPLSCNCWDRDHNNIACNNETVKLFDLPDKQTYLERHDELSPEYQPDGRPSAELRRENIQKAFAEGYLRFEWLHQNLKGEPIPCEVTLVKTATSQGDILVSYTHDLRSLHATMEITREADERTRIMLDATPLCANFWDKNGNNIDCNQEAVNLFGLRDKQEYLDRFGELSPEYQPNGVKSVDLAAQYVAKAFQDGRYTFEWMHQKPNGEPIPSEITLVRVKRKDDYIVAGYTRDLRELKATMAKMREADERSQIMLDATPLCANFWDKNGNNIDCNQEAVNLFELKDKQEYLDRFFELSPEIQPCGTLSAVLAKAKIDIAFAEGYCKFEWMHQMLNGAPVPSEITLVRVKHKDDYIVAGYTRDLRELKATMAKMREADERSQIMLDATPLCANFWDKNYNNIDCNLEAVNLFGLKNKQEYLDRFFELSPQYQPNGRLTSEMALEKISTAFNEGYCKFEWMHQTLDGQPIPSEITLVRVKHKDDYIVAGYTRDLRELKDTLDKMRAADERTQIMLDATPLCCNLWDTNFNNIDCNQEAVNLFGLRDKQEYLERFFELSPKYQPCGTPSAVLAKEKIVKAFDEGYCRFEWMHQKLNGDPVPSEITLVRVRYKDGYIVAGYTRDLRELKAMLAEMHKVEADLRLARDAAEESTRAKSEFLANMSHEIRTPMNGILGMLHLILNTEVTEKQRNYLEKTEQSAKSLLRILNDILDFSKIEAGKLEIEHNAFSLPDLIKDLHGLFTPKAREKELDFDVEMAESIPNTVIGDAGRVQQVLLNIISNAVKFTNTGGRVKLAVQSLKQEGRYCQVQFMVQDSGIGMTPGQIRNLFSPFTQADTSITRTYGGTGLGLAISKNLVDMMHGKLWATSDYGHGSTFYFTARFELPDCDICGPDMPSVTQSCAADSIETANGSAMPHLLLAEDNDINQMIAQELLEAAGYTVDIANNGREAISMLNSQNYALVLMDIQMPIMDGLSATRTIRGDDRFSALPIIAMSAHAMTGDREKSLESGMNDHLTKPIDPDILYTTLQKWLK